MAYTTPRTWVAGEVVTAALLNTHLRDNLNAINTDASWTPAWTNTGTANVLGNGTLTGRLVSANKRVEFQITLTWGSTTVSGNGNWVFSLPVTMNSFGGQLSEILYYDSSAGSSFWGKAFNLSTITIQPLSNASPAAAVTATAPFTWATSDICAIKGRGFAA